MVRDVFFYGLFMDENVLRAKGVQPERPRKAVVDGYQLRIGQRAMLVAQASSKAYGMVYALSDNDLKSLYSEPGLNMYRAETVVARFEDGSRAALSTYNLPEEFADEETNGEYAAKLRAVLERLGFPVTF